jgi:hypothetical protein
MSRDNSQIVPRHFVVACPLHPLLIPQGHEGVRRTGDLAKHAEVCMHPSAKADMQEDHDLDELQVRVRACHAESARHRPHVRKLEASVHGVEQHRERCNGVQDWNSRSKC